METITVIIPDGLTAMEELKMIKIALDKNYLPTAQKLIGSSYRVQHMDTQINIVRQPVEKPVATMDCTVCQIIFEVKLGKKLWINYGGKQRRRIYCSEECRKIVIGVCGDRRSSTVKKNLKHFMLFK